MEITLIAEYDRIKIQFSLLEGNSGICTIYVLSLNTIYIVKKKYLMIFHGVAHLRTVTQGLISVGID